MSMSVQAVFNYPRRDPTGVPPKINKTGDNDASKETMLVDQVDMQVHDARQLEAPPTLDRQGFQLVPHTTAVDFSSPEDVASRYVSEMEELVRKHTGAERCILFDHTIRRVHEAGSAKGFGVASKGGFTASAVNKVHGDYTAWGAPRRVLELSRPTESGSFVEPPLSEKEAQEIVAARRFMIVNVWRNISREAPVKRMPLALVDCTSVGAEDTFTVELVFKDRVGENLALDQKQEHRWCYFPDMEFEEALLFKTFDNVDDGDVTGRYTIHSAFDDPTTRPEDPTRESIEVRVLAIFPECFEDGTAEPQSKKRRVPTPIRGSRT